MLDLIALLIIPLLIILATFAILFVHSLPEKIAVRRDHPYVDAVVAMSWMGLLTMGLLMPVAFIWAFVPIRFGGNTMSEINDRSDQQRHSIQVRLAALESAVHAMVQETEFNQ